MRLATAPVTQYRSADRRRGGGVWLLVAWVSLAVWSSATGQPVPIAWTVAGLLLSLARLAAPPLWRWWQQRYRPLELECRVIGADRVDVIIRNNPGTQDRVMVDIVSIIGTEESVSPYRLNNLPAEIAENSEHSLMLTTGTLRRKREEDVGTSTTFAEFELCGAATPTVHMNAPTFRRLFENDIRLHLRVVGLETRRRRERVIVVGFDPAADGSRLRARIGWGGGSWVGERARLPAEVAPVAAVTS